MENMFQSFRSHNRYKLEQEKNSIKLKCNIACIVYTIKQ